MLQLLICSKTPILPMCFFLFYLLQQPSDMVRSFDDSNVDMLSHYGAIQQQQQNPQYGVRGGLVQQQQQPPQHPSMALNSQNVGGGGTLPRSLVKPRPIAKISAILSNPQQGQLHQSDFQSSDLCKKTFASSSDNLKQTVRTISIVFDDR